MVKPSVFKIVWDNQALEQFKEILTYLKEQNKQAPKIVKEAIIERIELIKSNPNIFETDRLKDNPSSEFKAFIVFSYRVTYQVRLDKKEIRILRIRHTSREPLGY